MFANQYSPSLTLPSFTPLAGTLNSDVPPMTDAHIALADVHLRQLAQLRDIGMRMAANAEADIPEGVRPPPKNAMMSAYAQLTKAIRQIMALEEEIIGLREKRVAHIHSAWKKEKATAVRRSVEKSLTVAKPQMLVLHSMVITQVHCGNSVAKNCDGLRDARLNVCVPRIETNADIW